MGAEYSQHFTGSGPERISCLGPIFPFPLKHRKWAAVLFLQLISFLTEASQVSLPGDLLGSFILGQGYLLFPQHQPNISGISQTEDSGAMSPSWNPAPTATGIT